MGNLIQPQSGYFFFFFLQSRSQAEEQCEKAVSFVTAQTSGLN